MSTTSTATLRGLTEPVPKSAGPAVVGIGETYNATTPKALPARPSPGWSWWPKAGGTVTFRDRSVQEILLPAIAAARKFIYIEDQYLIAMCAGEAIRNALPHRWAFRKRFVDRIATHPDAAKVRIFVLCDSPAGKPTFGRHTYVHAKMMVFDDEAAVIGSANVNRRGWEHDAEVIAGIAGNARDGTPLAHKLRTRLWAEHLGLAESAVADPIASKDQWTKAPARRVCPYDPVADTDPFLPDSLIPEDTADLPFPLATSPCCKIHPGSCPPPAATPPGTTTTTPITAGAEPPPTVPVP
jgi:phosphatidylserine/phosphatidylglycerophosphate/cardiolipin synthase-like enzyme